MIYHPKNDIYHCCFRLLSIIRFCEQSISVDKISIIDFYLVFPNFVNEITLPRGNTKIKKEFSKMNPPFEVMPNKKILFSELKDFQRNAISILRAKDIIELDKNLIKKSSEYSCLLDKFFEYNNIVNDKSMVKLIKCLIDIEMLGGNGLKKRTGLMEYRYDSI